MLSLVRRFRRRRHDPTAHDASDALLDCAPLRDFLAARLPCKNGVWAAIGENIASGDLAAACVTTTRFSTGQPVSWVQGRGLTGWDHPTRVGIQTELNLDHFLASTALSLIVPAMRIDDNWYGDGDKTYAFGLRPHQQYTLVQPTSSQSRRVSGHSGNNWLSARGSNHRHAGERHLPWTRCPRCGDAGKDQLPDSRIPSENRLGLREIRCLCIEPSVNLGARETKSPDWLSIVLFNPDYLGAVIEIGWNDARRNSDDIKTFLEGRS